MLKFLNPIHTISANYLLGSNFRSFSVPDLADILKNKFPFEPTSGQSKVFSMLDTFLFKSSEHNTLILKGYAGTGKTSLIGTLVQTLPLFNKKFVLLAPTGRAAKVMSHYTKRTAFTIHKKIYKHKIDPDSDAPSFKTVKNYHKDTLFIVDESSMIPTYKDFKGSSLLTDLINFVFQNENNHLILVGDTAQLPPVHQDQSLALDDRYLCEQYPIQTLKIELTEITRQAQNSGILLNATQLRNALGTKKSPIKFNTKAYSDIFRMTHERMEDGLRYAYDKYGMENTLVICRSNKSAVQYNKFIRHQILYSEEEIEAGDLIMVAKNNYTFASEDIPAGFIANGDFAKILKIKNLEDNYGLRFADLELQFVDYYNQEPFEAKAILDCLHTNTPALPQDLSKKLYQDVEADYAGLSKKDLKQAMKEDPYLNALQIKYAYALTCHKSQGGQWNAIFVDQGYLEEDKIDNDFIRWVYTAVTRATDELFLLNFHSKFF